MEQQFKLKSVENELEIQHSDNSIFKLLIGQSLSYQNSDLQRQSSQPCAIIIPINYLHNKIVVKSSHPLWLISAQQAYIEELLISLPRSDEFLSHSNIYHFSKDLWHSLDTTLHLLNQKAVNATSLQTRSLLLRFMFALCMESSLKTETLPSHTSYARRKLALSFKDLANRKAKKKISVNKFAEMLYLSYPKLYSICQEYFLDTPKNIVIKEKIIAIKRALITSNKTLYQIAEDFEFEDASNFSKFFIKHAQIHPSQFRRQSDWLSEHK